MLMGSLAQTQQILAKLLWSIISPYSLLLFRQGWMSAFRVWRRELRVI